MKKNLQAIGVLLSLGGVFALIALKFVYDYAHYSGSEICTKELEWSNTENSPLTHFNVAWAQEGGYTNDASCLNKTVVAGIVDVRTNEDVQNALAFAKENDLKLSIAGQKHSMGGQTMVRGGLILDMRSYNQILSIGEETVSVQAGILWSDLQKALDQQGLSVKAMQSINIFTVGGTVSVNAHGIDHRWGQVSSSIRSLKLMTPNGEILTLSPEENEELFHHVIGGYGLFGVVLEVELEHVPNVVYEKKTEYFATADFYEWYLKNIHQNPNIGLFYARLSIVPGKDFLNEVAVNTFETRHGEAPALNENFHNANIAMKRFVINFSKTGRLGKWLRWYLEKNHNPQVCLTRNEAMSQPDEVCDVTRNTAMFDSMQYLKNGLKDTDILQEYFVPFHQFDAFTQQLRTIVEEEEVNLLNVTIRVVHADPVSTLAYAHEDTFAFVLYFNHQLSQEDQENLTAATNRLIEASMDLGGSFYLPYQLVYSKMALQTAYPAWNSFIEAKQNHDPEEIFSNKWYEKYAK